MINNEELSNLKDKLMTSKFKNVEFISGTSIFQIKVEKLTFEDNMLMIYGKCHNGKDTFKFNLEAVNKIENFDTELVLKSYSLYVSILGDSRMIFS